MIYHTKALGILTFSSYVSSLSISVFLCFNSTELSFCLHLIYTLTAKACCCSPLFLISSSLKSDSLFPSCVFHLSVALHLCIPPVLYPILPPSIVILILSSSLLCLHSFNLSFSSVMSAFSLFPYLRCRLCFLQSLSPHYYLRAMLLYRIC